MRAIIYNRVSTKGKEQNPRLQRKDCLEFAKENRLEVIETFEEKGSAWKLKSKRPIWEKVQDLAIKQKAHIILWRYDRAFRNKQEFFKFMKIMFEVHNLKVYSVKEPSVISFYNLIQSTKADNPIFDNLLKGLFKALWDFQIEQAGEEAEEESRKKSERVKLAVIKREGEPTKSYKGNIWGRSALPKKTIREIIEIHKENPSMSLREISQSISYWDKNKNKKFVSKSAVHKILSKENKQN